MQNQGPIENIEDQRPVLDTERLTLDVVNSTRYKRYSTEVHVHLLYMHVPPYSVPYLHCNLDMIIVPRKVLNTCGTYHWGYTRIFFSV
jgi:hypothetical protein